MHLHSGTQLARRRPDLVAERPRAVLPAGSAAYWLSGALGVVAVAASAVSFYAPGVLRGPAVSQGTVRGTALVVLYVAVPLIFAAMAWTVRGSARALVVWVGAVAYVLYQAVLFLFATPFNTLYLVYVAMFGLALWSWVALVSGTDVEALRRRFHPRLPRRGIAIYSWVIVTLTALTWLRSVVPASLVDAPRDYLAGSGMTTNPVVIQDLAFWLPLLTVAAAWLWRDKSLGYLLVGGVLTMLVLESIGVAVDQWFGSRADPTTPWASTAMVAPMLVLAAVGTVPLLFYYLNLDRPGSRPRADRPLHQTGLHRSSR